MTTFAEGTLIGLTSGSLAEVQPRRRQMAREVGFPVADTAEILTLAEFLGALTDSDDPTLGQDLLEALRQQEDQSGVQLRRVA